MTFKPGEPIDPRMIRSHRPGQPAEVFAPGEILREELEARGWTEAQLASIVGWPVQTVHAILTGQQPITAPIARELGTALGTGPELWMNLETAYRLRTAPPPDPGTEEVVP